MSNYFKDFPVVDYRFGSNEAPVQFQHLGTYIDIIDQVKEYKQFYQTYSIQNLERPDHTSYKLYGSSNYYWTFYLMNEKLRVSGWPVENSRVYPLAQQYYPNMVVQTTGIARDADDEAGTTAIPMIRSETFVVGAWVWFQNSRKAGQILRIDRELGLLHISLPNTQPADSELRTINEADALYIRDTDSSFQPTEVFEVLSIDKQYKQFDAPHHYEDPVTGDWVYPTWEDDGALNLDSITTRQSVSYFQRLREKNDDLREISVIKPESLLNIITEFNQLMRGV
jgi:hypothetical protein